MSSSYNTLWIKHKLVVSIYSNTETSLAMSGLAFSVAPYQLQCSASLIVALVLSRLDYCNSVLFGLPANLIQRLQSIQNAADWLIFRIRRPEHIYPSAHQPSLAARSGTYLLQTGSYDIDTSTAPLTLRPSYSRISPAFPTWHPRGGACRSFQTVASLGSG